MLTAWAVALSQMLPVAANRYPKNAPSSSLGTNPKNWKWMKLNMNALIQTAAWQDMERERMLCNAPLKNISSENPVRHPIISTPEMSVHTDVPVSSVCEDAAAASSNWRNDASKSCRLSGNAICSFQ